MKRSKTSLIIFVSVSIVALWIAYAQRVRIGAWVWHYRHGTSLGVGSYVVPVPANWFVEDLDNGNQLLVRLDTADTISTRQLKAHAGIMVLSGKPMTSEGMDRLQSIETTSLKQNGAAVVQRDFSINGEIISCLSSNAKATGIYDTEPIHWNCKSFGGLQIIVTSTESDMQQVWEIVSGIRKKD